MIQIALEQYKSPKGSPGGGNKSTALGDDKIFITQPLTGNSDFFYLLKNMSTWEPEQAVGGAPPREYIYKKEAKKVLSSLSPTRVLVLGS